MAAALSVRHLFEEVDKRCATHVPRPSLQWLRLQFWPKDPHTKASLQHTGRLKVKFMVQQRQLRKPHEDSHYASAYFRYQKEMAIQFRRYAWFVSQDDKHKIKVGEPGTPLAAIERGKQVIVGMNTVFQVADHDFSQLTLTPSVNFLIDIPEDIEGSFYAGKVHVGIKSATFQASSPIRHATELCQILKATGQNREVLFLYTDGGPDHRVNYISVQLTLIMLFLELDLDAVIAVRTPPGHSWKNPAERIMSILNLGMQSVGVMRQEMEHEYEQIIKRCNNMQQVRNAAEKDPKFTEAITDSLQQPISLISSIIQHLELKGEKFEIFRAATNQQMKDIEDNVKRIDDSLNRATSRKVAETTKNLKEFFHQHCESRQYSFSILKCKDKNCAYHNPPRLPEDAFSCLHALPDPMLSEDQIHYKPFQDVYGKKTNECNKPSTQPGRKKEPHGIAFNPSAQTAARVNRIILCQECDKPRVLHSAKKLKLKELEELDRALEDVDYTCGTVLQDYVKDPECILSRVFVRQDLKCAMPMEIPYYSSSSFPLVCCHCANGTDLTSGENVQDIYPTCHDCLKHRPRIFKRKRKLFEPSS